MQRWTRAAIRAALVALVLVCQAVAPSVSADTLDVGRDRFMFTDWPGPPVRVFTYKPEGFSPTTPVVFILHGTRRNADVYRDQWAPLAEDNGFLVVAPEFIRTDFPQSFGYNLGNVYTRDGALLPRERWAFTLIEGMFDRVKALTGSIRPTYSLYGHSAGSQFVHRFLYYMPQARVQRAVAANAGWYTLPSYDEDFPYGLKGTGLPPEYLGATLSRPLVVLLGEDDDNPNSANLRRTPEAMRQGRHRLARGKRFFELARQQAERLAVPFNWHLDTVPDVGHNNARMAPAAVAYLLDGVFAETGTFMPAEGPDPERR